MMALSHLSDAFDRIEAGLRRCNRTMLLSRLNDGVDSSTVAEALSGVLLAPDSAIADLWCWRDGTRLDASVTLDDVEFFPGFHLLSLEDAVEAYRDYASDDRWSSGWLPLFANGGGDFFVVDLRGDGPHAVRHFRIDEIDHPVEFESVSSMIQTIATAYDESVIYIDERGFLEFQSPRYVELAAKLNPTVAWWK